MPNLPLARRPRRDMQFGNCEMENFTIKWLTNLVAQDVWSYELLLVEYYPQLSCVLMCSQPSQWVFYFSGANCGFKPCTWNLRRLPPWGVVGNLWRRRISVELKCRKVWICQGKCLGHVDREHAIALLKSYGRVEIACFLCSLWMSGPFAWFVHTSVRCWTPCWTNPALPFERQLMPRAISLRALYPMSSWKAGHCSDF